MTCNNCQRYVTSSCSGLTTDFMSNSSACNDVEKRCAAFLYELPAGSQECCSTVTTAPQITDSGSRREFDSGAVRDIHEGKGRCDLMPIDVVAELFNFYSASEYGSSKFALIFKELSTYIQTLEVDYLFHCLKAFISSVYEDDLATALLDLSIHYEAGAKKYGEHNWERGIPQHCYIDSACRHLLKHIRGDADEPHGSAFMWNIFGAIYNHRHNPGLIDVNPLDYKPIRTTE